MVFFSGGHFPKLKESLKEHLTMFKAKRPKFGQNFEWYLKVYLNLFDNLEVILVEFLVLI